MNAVSSNLSKPTKISLRAFTAEELMTPNPVSIRDSLRVSEALSFFIDKGVSGAPVIDAAGRPIGVLSQSDLLFHKWQLSTPANSELFPVDGDLGGTVAPPPEEESVSAYAELQRRWAELRLGQLGETLVGAVMTPVVYSVGRHAGVAQVIREMCDLDVHRLFVVDSDGVLIGVISTMDVLRHLMPAAE